MDATVAIHKNQVRAGACIGGIEEPNSGKGIFIHENPLFGIVLYCVVDNPRRALLTHEDANCRSILNGVAIYCRSTASVYCNPRFSAANGKASDSDPLPPYVDCRNAWIRAVDRCGSLTV